MSRVIDEFRINQYTVLKLDVMPTKIYKKYRIEGVDLEPVPLYDMPQCIAVLSEQSFIGKVVEFV